MKKLLKHNLTPFIILFFLGIYYVYKGFYFQPHDFANYYYSAFFLESGEFNIQIYNPSWFNLEIAKYTKNVFAAFAPNTPFLSLFFVPFTYFSFDSAKVLFNCISLLLFVVSIHRLFKYYNINSKYVLLILIVFIVPFKNNILFGQVYFLIFFLITEGYLAYKKDNLKKMAIFWGFAILLKVFPVLLFLFLLLEKNWKATFYTVISTVFLFLVSIFINGFDAWNFYFLEILPKASKGEISAEFVANYQSFLMFFKHLFIDSNFNDYNILSSEKIYIISLNTIKLFVLFFGIYFSFKEKNTFKKFSYWVVSFFMISPYSSSYGSLLLILPLLYFVRNKYWKTIFIFSLFLFVYCNFRYNLFGDSNIFLLFFKLFFLCLFFYGMFIYREKKQFPIFVLSLVISASLYLIKSPEERKEITSVSNNHIAFITNYHIENNLLFYTYWNENGLQTKKLALQISSSNNKNINIKNNSIYIDDKKIALPKSNKKKATIVNDSTLLYLSDLDRGYGFYSLRKIQLKSHE